MQSFGIRFGQGFDRANILKLMHGVEVEHDYDFVVIGSSPGGIACAREASSAGKRVAIIKYKYIVIEDLEDSIEDSESYIDLLGEHSSERSHSDTQNLVIKQPSLQKVKKKRRGSGLNQESNPVLKNVAVYMNDSRSKNFEPRPNWSTKIRKSNNDLKNSLYKRGREGRKLMIQATNFQQTVQNAKSFGWRLPVNIESISINWKKMSESVMDEMMKENWMLMNILAQEQVEVIEGIPSFVDVHTIQIQNPNGGSSNITADIICLALSSEYIIPSNIDGADEFGITCDDFIRLEESPKNTLIVGGTPEGIECAAVVASCGLPVVVISRTRLLKKYDSEMTQLVIDDLKSKGVVFLEYTTLTAINFKKGGKLLAKLQTELSEEEKPFKTEKVKEFDTVVFAVGRKVSFDFLSLKNAGLDQNWDFESFKTNLDNVTSVPHIYVINDTYGGHSQGPEISETAGRLLGKRLFHNTTEIMDYTFIPFAMSTPVEYACVGISEENALFKFGSECVTIYQFMFTPFKMSMPRSAQGIVNQCLVKAITYKAKDLIMGLHICGPEAGEVIQGFAGALKLGLTMTKLQGLIGIRGTTAEKISQLGNSIKSKVS